MALANSALLRPQTVLQQLLEEINFQRAKEMRQMLKDDGGFVMLQGTTYWTDLFVRHFLFQAETEQSIDSDDLLFFVRKKHIKGTSRHMPKFETDVDVYRKDSRKLPIGDPDVDWEETVYLNLIIHQFNYTLTLAICTRTSPKELQVLKRHSQRVYASPSRRKMDTKGDGEEMTYPHICFMVDNFDEVFCDIMVRDGEMVCVELVANDRDGTVQGVIFLGSIRYDALKKVYDARQSSISSKLAQRMTFGLFSGGGPQTRCEFVRMKGPQGKGHAEMAVTKPKGSGVETPTSEPGFCMTDMYDEWDEDPDDFLNYRHQRRLSDPSANLNNYSRYGWKTKPTAPNEQSSKALSQNEGLDSLANELSEIEAGDLRDDGRTASPKKTVVKSSSRARSASVTTTTASKSAFCCNCFGPLKAQWGDDAISNQMSDVYCRTCEYDNYDLNDAEYVRVPKDRFDSPAILSNVTQRKNQRNKTTTFQPKINSTFLSTTKNLEISKISTSTATTNVNANEQRMDGNATAGVGNLSAKNSTEDYELGDDVVTNDENLNANTNHLSQNRSNRIDTKEMIRVRGKEELPASEEQIDVKETIHTDNNDAISSINQCNTYIAMSANTSSASEPIEKTVSSDATKQMPKKVICTDDHPLMSDAKIQPIQSQRENSNEILSLVNSMTNSMTSTPEKVSILKRMHRMYSTLPKIKRNTAHDESANITNRPPLSIPTRTTPDGTTIYYLCDLSKNVIKELDDGACNPLWTSKGFMQTFHFYKEHKRNSSVPLNAFLTYVTLPWWAIAKDLLDHRETPILTF